MTQLQNQLIPKKKSYQFSVTKFNENNDGIIEGYANTFNFKDYAGDITMKGAFARTLNKHMKEGSVPAMLWQHQQDQVIGVWDEAYEDEKGLRIRGHLIAGVQKADEAKLLIEAGAINGLSIGYYEVETQWDSKQKANLLLDVELFEVSIVTSPCNTQSRIDAAKSHLLNGEMPSEREMEKCLREIGLSQKQAKLFMANGYKALAKKPDEEEPEESIEEDDETVESNDESSGSNEEVEGTTTADSETETTATENPDDPEEINTTEESTDTDEESDDDKLKKPDIKQLENLLAMFK